MAGNGSDKLKGGKPKSKPKQDAGADKGPENQQGNSPQQVKMPDGSTRSVGDPASNAQPSADQSDTAVAEAPEHEAVDLDSVREGLEQVLTIELAEVQQSEKRKDAVAPVLKPGESGDEYMLRVQKYMAEQADINESQQRIPFE